MTFAARTHIYPEGTEERIAALAVAALSTPEDPTGYAALGDHLRRPRAVRRTRRMPDRR